MARGRPNRRSRSAFPRRDGRGSNSRLLARAKPRKKPARARFPRTGKASEESELQSNNLRLVPKRCGMKDIAPRHTERFHARLIPLPASEAVPPEAHRPERLLGRVQTGAEVEPET